MDEDLNDPVGESWIPNKKGWHSQFADSLRIAKLSPPDSLEDLVDLCGVARLSILETSPSSDPNPMLSTSVLQIYHSAIELMPTAPHPAVPDRESLRTQSQMLNAVNELVAWCEAAKDSKSPMPHDDLSPDESPMPSILQVDSESEISAEYRDGGLLQGEPLTSDVVAQPEKYGLSGPYLSKNYSGPLLKLGRKHVYRHKEIAELSDRKSRRDSDN